jgi:signal transduction histidine kinase/integral membrane sensor domain MASE1
VSPLGTGLILFIPLSLIGNEIGSVLRYPDIGAAVLFAPYAALTAALVVSKRRDWIWFILFDSIAHFVTHWPQWPVGWVLLANVANIARALAAAVLLNRLLPALPRLESLRALLFFIVSAVLIAPAVGATVGAANVVLNGARQTYVQVWTGWFVSNALTGLTTLPALIPAFACAAGRYRLLWDRPRAIEALVLAATLAATCAFAFLSGIGRGHLALPLYAPLPVLMWAALRFGWAGAGVSLTVVTFAAIWSVDRGTGPFVAVLPDENVLALQIYVVLTAVPVLCLAATATARDHVAQLHGALLASLQDHVAILDANGVVLQANESWRRFAEASDTQSFHHASAGDGYLAACWSSASRGDATAAGVLNGVTSVLMRKQRRFEIEYEHPHGGRREAYMMTVEALERSDGGAVVTRANVTARRQAQMEIEEQRRELSRLARVAVLGQLSGAFAHELNQPLTAILSNAEAARHSLRRHPPDAEFLAEILRDIIADNQRAASVIDRLRALLKRGDQRLQLIDTRELIGEVVSLARTELITRQVDVATHLEPALPSLWGDKVQLLQVLLNLVLNGCEAMGGMPASSRRLVLIGDLDPSGGVHFAVRDCGTGIRPDMVDRLFEPFVTTKPDGLGLGLSISRTIVATHGGRLWGENNADGGATMHVVLPVAPPADVIHDEKQPALTARSEL